MAAISHQICNDPALAQAELPYPLALNLIKLLKLAGDDPDHLDNPDLMQTAWDMINLRCLPSGPLLRVFGGCLMFCAGCACYDARIVRRLRCLLSSCLVWFKNC